MKPASTLADKWILSRANRAAREVKKAFDAYLINDVTKLLYDFIWKDYCDWYLEIVKLQPESTPLAVEILEGILRMIHPVMPFVTEELWHGLTGNPDDVLIGRDDYITADEYKIDDEAEEEFEFIQRIIEAARLLRSNAKIAPSKSAEFIIRLKSADDLLLTETSRNIIEKICKVSAYDRSRRRRRAFSKRIFIRTTERKRSGILKTGSAKRRRIQKRKRAPAERT